MSKKVAVIMGSDSDLDTMRPCIQRLKSFGIPTEVHIISAHRTPAAAERFASQARENGFGAIIAAAGKAAHLAGVLAAYTTLPVIGVPIKTSMMGGLDALLSTVQMPKGIPVATRGGGRRGQRRHPGRPDAGPLRRGPEPTGWCEFKADMAAEVAEKEQSASPAQNPNAQECLNKWSLYGKTGAALRGQGQEGLRHRRPRAGTSWPTRTTPPPSTA